MTDRGEDLLTVSDIVSEYGWPPKVAQSLVKNLSRRGLVYRHPGFRRRLVRRKYIEPKDML